MPADRRRNGAEAALGGIVAGSGRDYALVKRMIEALVPRGGRPHGTDSLATALGVDTGELERAVGRWSGLSPEAFAGALTVGHVRRMLGSSSEILAADGAAGRRAHDFDVVVAATVTDAEGRRGGGLQVTYGFHESPFGTALVMMTGGGVCGLAFTDEDTAEGRRAALDNMTGRWPKASCRETPEVTGPVSARIFEAPRQGPRAVVPVVLVGTPFDLAVWRALLAIPMGRVVSYADIARHLGRPDATRAVGTANGRNPISFVVPCHRALRGDGSFGGYEWGLTRKRALIAWETGRSRQE